MGFTSDKFVAKTAETLFGNITREMDVDGLAENMDDIQDYVYYAMVSEVAIAVILIFGFLLAVYVSWKHKR